MVNNVAKIDSDDDEIYIGPTVQTMRLHVSYRIRE